jgi:hypothetical protein
MALDQLWSYAINDLKPRELSELLFTEAIYKIYQASQNNQTRQFIIP